MAEIYEAWASEEIMSQTEREAKIRSGQTRFPSQDVSDLMQGAIDIHVHLGPCAYTDRIADEVAYGIEATKIGMRAAVSKCHSDPTSSRLIYAQRIINDWAEKEGLKPTQLIGTCILGYPVGGLNLEAAKVSAGFGGKYVYTPVLDSKHHHQLHSRPGGIPVCDSKDELLPEMKEILDFIAEKDLVLGIAHQTTKERFILVDEALSRGVKRIEIVHPNNMQVLMTADQMADCAKKGAYIGYYGYPLRGHRGILGGMELFKETVKKVGADKIVCGTDCGGRGGPHPIDGYRLYIRAMLGAGVSKADLRKMVTDNAVKLLGLAD